MPELGYFAVFLIGLSGGVHCIGMCGGIVGALTMPLPGQQAVRRWPLILAYNFGRISCYTLVGVIVGAVGSASLLFNRWLPFQLILYVLANIMLVLLGLYLTGLTQTLAPIERIGHKFWKKIQPCTQYFLPARSWSQALPLGMLWGFLPCGLTYTILSMSLVSGSAVRGGALMLAFGLGTLPNLLLAGVLTAHFRAWMQQRTVRLVFGLAIMGMGVWGLWHVERLGERLWQGIICAV